jgi:ABC-2 type transport system permease protein
VLLQKFWMSCLGSIAVTTSLMLVSSLMLQLPWPRVAFFAGAITLMSATLSGLAVGLGALFPNFKEDNPSKIVSSFGGTLCLVVSFAYIASFVALTAVPDLRRVAPTTVTLSDTTFQILALALSLSVLLFPLLLALRRVKNLEI